MTTRAPRSDDPLDTLHARIDELEYVRAHGRERPVRRTERRRSPLRLLAMALFGAAVGFSCARTLGEPEVVVLTANPPVTPVAPLEMADGHMPWLVDVDGDGAKDFVFRAWQKGGGERALRVVAVDRRTLRRIWTSDAFYGEPHHRGRLVVTGGESERATGAHIALSDSSDTIYLLDAATGALAGQRFVSGYIAALRPIPGASRDVAVAFAKRREHADLFDMRSRFQRLELGDQPSMKKEVVTIANPSCGEDPSVACRVELDGSTAKQLRGGLPSYTPAFALEANGDRVVLVHVPAQPGPGVIEHAMRLDERGRIVWRTPLVPASRTWAPYPNTAPEGLTALSSGQVLHVYPLTDGSYRFVTRSLETGEVGLDVPIPTIAYGADVSAFGAQGSEAFLVVDRTLVVLDIVTGSVRGRVTSL